LPDSEKVGGRFLLSEIIKSFEEVALDSGLTALEKRVFVAFFRNFGI
jgi:hypothetical protein